MWPIKVLSTFLRTLMAAIMCLAEWQALQVLLSEGSGVERRGGGVQWG